MWRSLVARSAGGGEVISSNLVTPTNFPKFQTPSILPFFKASQGFETPQKQNQHNLVTFQYQRLIPYYNQKVGYLLVIKIVTVTSLLFAPLDILCVDL